MNVVHQQKKGNLRPYNRAAPEQKSGLWTYTSAAAEDIHTIKYTNLHMPALMRYPLPDGVLPLSRVPGAQWQAEGKAHCRGGQGSP